MNKSMYVKNNPNQILCGFRGSCVKPVLCEAALFHICLLKVIKMKKSGGVE